MQSGDLNSTKTLCVPSKWPAAVPHTMSLQPSEHLPSVVFFRSLSLALTRSTSSIKFCQQKPLSHSRKLNFKQMVISNTCWLACYKVAHADSLFLSLRERGEEWRWRGRGGRKIQLKHYQLLVFVIRMTFCFLLLLHWSKRKESWAKPLLLAATFSTFT